jgi:hypothetical protein
MIWRWDSRVHPGAFASMVTAFVLLSVTLSLGMRGRYGFLLAMVVTGTVYLGIWLWLRRERPGAWITSNALWAMRMPYFFAAFGLFYSTMLWLGALGFGKWSFWLPCLVVTALFFGSAIFFGRSKAKARQDPPSGA